MLRCSDDMCACWGAFKDSVFVNELCALVLLADQLMGHSGKVSAARDGSSG